DIDPQTNDNAVLTELKAAGDNFWPLRSNFCAMKKEDRKLLGDSLGNTAVGSKKFLDLLREAVDKYTKEVANLLTARLTILEGKRQAFEPASLLPHIEGEITQKLTTLYIGSKKTKAWDALLDVRELKQDSIE